MNGFQSFLKTYNLKEFYNSLNSAEYEHFRKACYTTLKVSISGSMTFGELNSYNNNVQACYSIASNLTQDKHYDLSMKLLKYGEKYSMSKDELAMFHISYALNYEKLKDIEKCNFHCEEAIKLGHNGYYAYDRLIKNYSKQKRWNDLIKVCDIVVKSRNPNLGNIKEYAKKKRTNAKEKLQKTNS